MTVIKRKLIEVALPLEAINRESAREKSIRHGHPSTMHLWWARRPLAACRAVLFAQLVDDPSSHPEVWPTEDDQSRERQRLFGIIERLVVWENLNDEALLREAHNEILKSTDGRPPAILDPFAGGGSIPLEAQRLGLEAHASDLNPVAVLINKALIEFPALRAGLPPVFPGAADQRLDWPKATGLSEDVRRYGQWINDEARRRIGHHYPPVTLPDGTTVNVVAWIWANSVRCPNPACSIQAPLVRSWWLGKKKGRESFIIPAVSRDADGTARITYSIGHGLANRPSADGGGTVGRSGATCLSCGTAIPLSLIRTEAQAGRLTVQLMAVVGAGDRQRHYFAPSTEQQTAAEVARPLSGPDLELSHYPGRMNVREYGMTNFSQLFTNRQLTSLTTFNDLVAEAREQVLRDALSLAVIAEHDEASIREEATKYADTVAVYLALAASRIASMNSRLCRWRPDAAKESVNDTFGRQALQMTWDFAEGNPFVLGPPAYDWSIGWIAKVIESLPTGIAGTVEQQDAAAINYESVLVSTDPPYYDNIGYAMLSDFFYGWLRKSLGEILPGLFGTVQTPKADELVADPYRHGGKLQASEFFEAGFNDVFARIRRTTPRDFPVTVFYAFKQSEADTEGRVSTGWQTLLEGMMKSGWEVTATWPMRTEASGRLLSQGTNALASSIVLALRPRPDTAEALTRRSFVTALRDELPMALRQLQQGSIAPVDLAQAAIGPGMAVFSRHSRIVEADGSDMLVRTALALINQVLDEVLAEQEGDFESVTRFCVKWFAQFGWSEAASGEADVLARAVNTAVSSLERGGVFRAAAGKARLLEPGEMSEDWRPTDDSAISVWEVAVRIAHALQSQGVAKSAELMRASSSRVDLDAVKELSYLLYSICEKNGWVDAAILFNGLGTSWMELESATSGPRAAQDGQGELDLDGDN